MPSLQNSAGAGKALKFAAANPLAPMANPFSDATDDAQSELQQHLAENVDRRLKKAMGELKDRHARGTNEVDDPDRAPTGTAYQAAAAESARRQADVQRQEEYDRSQEMQQLAAIKEDAKRMFQSSGSQDDSDSEDDYDYLLEEAEEDPELESIRSRRLHQIKQEQIRRAENMAKGHGQYRTISQDTFLTECIGSDYVACHFFHDDFERCKIMDHHLRIIAPLKTACKFVRLDVQKAPFFVGKLQIQTLPSLIVFKEGKVVDRLTGFEGLAVDPKDPDKWHTGRLQQWISTTGAIQYQIPTEEIRAEMKRLGIQPKGAIWSGEEREYDDYSD